MSTSPAPSGSATSSQTDARTPTSRADVRLAARYSATAGPVLLTGLQAVCRLPLDVRRHDRQTGRNTRVFMSGYQGSPLGTVDFAMKPLRALLDEHGVDFRPGMNELLAATAVLGTQAVPKLGSPLDGVVGIWYGKAPGIDQALDAVRHGNLMGTDPNGGVLALVGDDATAKSSTVPSGSEPVLRAALLPTLAASDAGDVLAFGLHGVAMSRATGTWVALKVATNVADGATVVYPGVADFAPKLPELDGAPYRHVVRTNPVAALAEQMEQSLIEVRLPLALEYARRNGLNRITARGGADRLGIVAAGQPYVEVRQALADMGLGSDEALAAAGIRLLKIGMPWPLEPQIVREFAAGLEEIVVVEDKGPFLEQSVKDVLFDLAAHPRVLGRRDSDGRPMLPGYGAVDADLITLAIAPRILARGDIIGVRARLDRLTSPPRQTLLLATAPKRTPYFCSGCPHNTSTKAPAGSLMGAGIGCHGMAVLMEPGQVGNVTGLTQMGGEGAQWIGQQDYVNARHTFQNIGDGTLSHSGLLAIRASIAARTNITYKILYNATVAMTGGQDAVGGYTVAQLSATLAAEGVHRIAITTDDPHQYRGVRLPALAKVYGRDRLMEVQEQLSRLDGTTVLIHDQPCATELRRNRKRGLAADPPTRVVINERICEGCGDCGKKSNCLSVTPTETEFGRKTQIHQASCNKDYSCLHGDCPSFMTVIPAADTSRAARQPAPLAADDLPAPQRLVEPDGFALRITGIGGTGVVTIAQIIATAGFVDGLAPRALDQVGLSQKAGPVVSDVSFDLGEGPLSPKLGRAGADLYLACDVLVGGDQKNLAVADAARTVAVVSTAEVASGSMVRNPETAFPDYRGITAAIDATTRRDHNAYVDAKGIAEQLFGGDQFANMVLVGSAFQAGALPLSEAAIEKAIELNGVAVEANVQAFRRGRQAVADPAAVDTAIAALHESPAPGQRQRLAPPAAALIARVGAVAGSELDDALRLRVPDLIDYHDEQYAARFVAVVARVLRVEQERTPDADGLAVAVAVGAHKLMAYKDEYEVARLALDQTERAKIDDRFGPGAKVSWRLHPPVLRALGMRNKISLGSWFTVFFRLLRGMKRVRGTRLDVFGYAAVRRVERELVAEYLATIERVFAVLNPANHRVAVQIAALPDLVRGYEHVKLANVERYRTELARLTAELSTALEEPADA